MYKILILDENDIVLAINDCCEDIEIDIEKKEVKYSMKDSPALLSGVKNFMIVECGTDVREGQVVTEELRNLDIKEKFVKVDLEKAIEEVKKQQLEQDQALVHLFMAVPQ